MDSAGQQHERQVEDEAGQQQDGLDPGQALVGQWGPPVQEDGGPCDDKDDV